MRCFATYFFENGTSVHTSLEADDIHHAKQSVGALLKEPMFETGFGPPDTAVIIRNQTVTHVTISMETEERKGLLPRARAF